MPKMAPEAPTTAELSGAATSTSTDPAIPDMKYRMMNLPRPSAASMKPPMTHSPHMLKSDVEDAAVQEHRSDHAPVLAVQEHGGDVQRAPLEEPRLTDARPDPSRKTATLMMTSTLVTERPPP